MHLLSNIHDASKLGLKQLTTKFSKIREVGSLYEAGLNKYQFLVVLSTDGRLAIYDIKTLEAVEDDLSEIKANRTIKLKDRLTALSILDMSTIQSKLGKKRRRT